MAKPKLLYLCHRIPYPPNKGDKIRSFNILKALAVHYDIYLGCFIDDAFDYQYEAQLANWCSEYYCRPQHKFMAKLKGLSSFLSAKPITLPYYFDQKLQQWVDHTIREQKIDTVFIYSSAMAQYVDGKMYAHLHRVLDFVDIDSDKWRQYAEKKHGLMRFIYQREFRLLAQKEQYYCKTFDYSLFVSEDEAKLFRQQTPALSQAKVKALLNGVDTVFFDPAFADSRQSESAQQQELPCHQPYLVFTGAMDYWANVDAVRWFVTEVWPALKQQRPELWFYIVGGNPTAEVLALAQQAGVVVTGRVHDIRPYIANAALVVAPLRIARGIQNKVLEAMAMNKAIVATGMAMEGINAPNGAYLQQSDDATQFGRFCLQLLEQTASGNPNRQWVIDHFTWPATLAPLLSMVGRQ